MSTAPALRLIASMATRPLLADRTAAYAAAGLGRVDAIFVGGVDALRRVREGEAFDLVVLAADAIDRLAADGHLDPRHRLDWVRSATAIAVPAGRPKPPIDTEEAVRRAVLEAPRIGLSTGPSGVAITKLFARWGLADELAAKTVQAPAGVPVGALLARGEVDLGFQQVSELLGLDGIDLVGPLPADVEIVTIFAAAVGARADDPAAAAAFLEFLADPAAAPVLRRHGMDRA